MSISENGFPSGEIDKTGRYIPLPRVLSTKQVAARLGRSVNWLYNHMPRLKQLGFPSKDEELGGWDSLAIEAWQDNRSGIRKASNIEDQMLEAIRGNC